MQCSDGGDVGLSAPVASSSAAAAAAEEPEVLKRLPQWLDEAVWAEARRRMEHLGLVAVREDYEDMWFTIGKIRETVAVPMEDEDDEWCFYLPHFLRRVLGEEARRSMVGYAGAQPDMELIWRMDKLADKVGVGQASAARLEADVCSQFWRCRGGGHPRQARRDPGRRSLGELPGSRGGSPRQKGSAEQHVGRVLADVRGGGH